MTGPAIALVALVLLVWSLVLLAGTLGTIDLTGEDGANGDGEADEWCFVACPHTPSHRQSHDSDEP